MMNRAMGALWLVLAVGCAASEAAETGEIEQHERCFGAGVEADEYECQADCGGCGHNGLRESSWNQLFGGFNRQALKMYGVWIDSASGARSLCDPVHTWTDHCVMRNGYSQWLAANPTRREDIMSHLVAAIAQTDYWVQDPGTGTIYWGSFNLRPQALTQTWDYRTQETITAALLAQVNAVKGVAICMMNEQTPANCSFTGGRYHEADFFGNHFQFFFAAVSGGADAPDPDDNLRLGDAGDDPAAPAFAYVYEGERCEYAGSSNRLHATRCKGENGVWWEHPVTVRTPGRPRDWYYGDLVPQPDSFPWVPIDD